MTTLHVLPINDLIDHTDGSDCICGPTIEPSREVTRWIILAVSSAYAAAMVASYIHTRRNRADHVSVRRGPARARGGRR